jgi:hypothetical protein
MSWSMEKLRRHKEMQVEALPLDVATAILMEIGSDFLPLQTETD